MRQKHNKRASKYTLEKETSLTHFGKKIDAMSKSELRQAHVGSGDEANDVPFSYDDLIAQSKEHRATVRRQKMEAEAELDELNSSFKTVYRQMERRDIDQDKLNNGKTSGEDDLAFLARSFQMDNIKKAMAGDRSMTELEKEDQINQLVRRSEAARDAAAEENRYDEEDDHNGEYLVSEEVDETPRGTTQEAQVASAPTAVATAPVGLIPFIRTLLEGHPRLIGESRSKLVELARVTTASEMDEFFKTELFSPDVTPRLALIKIASILFPLDHVRHSIGVPTLKLLESLCLSPEANLCHLALLTQFLLAAPKYSPAFFILAAKLFRSGSNQDDVLGLVSQLCSKFTREALYGPIEHFFPELLESVRLDSTPFVPLRMHFFKPVEVLCLEPAFHEDGHEWTGQHKEIRAAKKLQQQVKDDKRLTAKEMRREAGATEAFHAIQKKKDKEQKELTLKRTMVKMDQAETNFRLMRTDQGKEDDRKMKSNKKKRRS